MRSGVKAKDIVPGTGEEALSGKTVAVLVHLFLNQGTELTDSLMGGPRVVIDLGRRDCIAGLRYGIVGMRVGGTRELKISPHLAFGKDGIPSLVPPNSLIRAVVELLDVREPGVRKPEDYPPGKHLHVFHPGVAVRNQPRWQFDLRDEGRGGVLLTYPGPGMKWRHTRNVHQEVHLDAETMRLLIAEAEALPARYPKDCFLHGELWADMAEPGNAITRDRLTNTLCLTLGVVERGQQILNYSLAETSPALTESPLFKIIGEWIARAAATNPPVPPDSLQSNRRQPPPSPKGPP